MKPASEGPAPAGAAQGAELQVVPAGLPSGWTPGESVPWASFVSLHQLLDFYAEGATAGCAAIVEDATQPLSLTYAQLRTYSTHAASNIALYLKTRGYELNLGSDLVLATCMHRGVRWYASLVAAMRLGLPVAMMSTDLPDKQLEEARNQQIGRELQPVVVVDEDFEEAARKMDGVLGTITAVSTFFTASSPYDSDRVPPASRSRADALFYSYTGGTTGGGARAKCVVVTHAMALHEAEAYAALIREVWPPRTPFPSRVLQQTPTYWAASCVGQIDIALALGGCIVVALAQPARDITTVTALAIQRLSVDVMGAVPSFLALLEPQECKSIRWLLSWGEALPSATIARWRASDRAISDLLIATEYWLCLHSTTVGLEGQNGLGSRSAFRAVRGASVRVEKEHGDDEAGRLCIKGPMVMRGYLHGDQIGDSSEFVTNDVVKEVAAGQFMYCGRADFMTKAKGQWLDLGSIEGALESLPGVQEAALVPDPAGGGQHTACLCLGQQLAVPEVLRAVRQTLQKCLGARLVLCSALPRHAVTRKVDRLALKTFVASQRCGGQEGAGGSSIEHGRSFPVARQPDGVLSRVVSNAGLHLVAAVALCCGFRPTDALRLSYLWHLSIYLGNDWGRGGLCERRAAFFSHIFWRMPFGRLGLFTALLWGRRRSKKVSNAVSVLVLWGAVSAMLRRRFMAWPLAFWASLPMEMQRGETQRWTKWLVRCASRPARFLRRLRRTTPSAYSSWKPKAGWGLPADVCASGVEAPRICAWCKVAGRSLRPDDCEDTPFESAWYCDECWQKYGRQWWQHRTVDDIEAPPVERASDNTVSVAQALSPAAGPPRASTKLLAGIIERLTGASCVNEATSLAELGVDSMRGLQLVQTIRATTGKDILYSRLLNCATMGALTDLVENTAAGEGSSGLQADARAGAEAGPVEVASFFAPGQWWFVCSWLFEHKGSPHGVLDETRFRRAAAALVRRHPALRARLVDPLDLLRFLFDGTQVLVMVHRALAARPRCLVSTVLRAALRPLSLGLRKCWPRVQVSPPSATPQGGKGNGATHGQVAVVHCLERDVNRLSRAATRADQFMPPGSITLYQVHEEGGGDFLSKSFVHVGMSHGLSDGFSIYPLLTDLGELYAAEEEVQDGASQAAGDTTQSSPRALEILEERFFATVDGKADAECPSRQSMRGQLLSSYGEGFKHDIRLGSAASRACEQLAEQYGLSMDVLLLALTSCALARVDGTEQVDMTLYTAQRDGPGEAAMVGLFADWRDIVFDFSAGALGGLTLCGAVLKVGECIRHREWVCFDGLRNMTSTLVNVVTFDSQPVHGFHRSSRPGGNFYPRMYPGGDRTIRTQRPRRLVWERQELEEWWLALDLQSPQHDVWWTRRFVKALQSSLAELRMRPCSPLFPAKPRR